MMSPRTIWRLQDALAKLQAQNKLVSGGTQYSPDVSLGVAGINKGKAMMRNQKTQILARPVPLRKLQS
jgi:hypothetical protein